ncbi:hypothetical protein QYH69_04480 [Paraburkholderia sp. SARCC-3016]|jgi:hypothetical protein|uniref:hypothetical protein n=1 Tax=Paraburkholderia sp. SARCC-3016 TaxID=3058611 RepID=UPI0028095D32|nr:hypothetical protein [Paraburkholderia sp. SARCC-3016]MDQ7976497.1 hypothetical protein [Paraburkholderia sp. SARCC-3016]
MVQMVLMSIGGRAHAQQSQRMTNAALARRMLGFAVVSSGYAVLVAHGIAHVFGG